MPSGLIRPCTSTSGALPGSPPVGAGAVGRGGQGGADGSRGGGGAGRQRKRQGQVTGFEQLVERPLEAGVVRQCDGVAPDHAEVRLEPVARLEQGHRGGDAGAVENGGLGLVEGVAQNAAGGARGARRQVLPLERPERADRAGVDLRGRRGRRRAQPREQCTGHPGLVGEPAGEVAHGVGGGTAVDVRGGDRGAGRSGTLEGVAPEQLVELDVDRGRGAQRLQGEGPRRRRGLRDEREEVQGPQRRRRDVEQGAGVGAGGVRDVEGVPEPVVQAVVVGVHLVETGRGDERRRRRGRVEGVELGVGLDQEQATRGGRGERRELDLRPTPPRPRGRGDRLGEGGELFQTVPGAGTAVPDDGDLGLWFGGELDGSQRDEAEHLGWGSGHDSCQRDHGRVVNAGAPGPPTRAEVLPGPPPMYPAARRPGGGDQQDCRTGRRGGRMRC